MYHDVKAISAGYLHSVLLLANGTVFSFGRNASGQLGNGSTADSQTGVLSVTDAVVIVAGAYHTLAVDNRGFGWSWGQNSDGQIGDSTHANRSAPFKLIRPMLP